MADTPKTLVNLESIDLSIESQWANVTRTLLVQPKHWIRSLDSCAIPLFIGPNSSRLDVLRSTSIKTWKLRKSFLQSLGFGIHCAKKHQIPENRLDDFIRATSLASHLWGLKLGVNDDHTYETSFSNKRLEVCRKNYLASRELQAFAFSYANMSLPLETQGVRDPVDEVGVVSDNPWVVIVWNDPINTMQYVTFVFQKLFGYGKEKAEKLTMDVHEKGKAAVSNGSRERCEMDVFRLHEHGLWATMEHDE